MLRSLFPLFGCGLMMLVCTSVMGAGRRKSPKPSDPADPPVTSDEVRSLRDEVARLRLLDEQRQGAQVDDSPS